MPFPVRPTVLALAAALLVGAGGCATTGAADEEHRRREAAIARWSRCVERHGDALETGVAGRAPEATSARVARGCEGHRRDVVVTFPEHMERRVGRLLDERAARRLQLRLRHGARDASLDALVQRLIESFSPG